MIFLRLAAVGGLVALLLWAMEGRRWIDAIDFLFPFFSLATTFALASFEAQDGLRRPAFLLLTGMLAALAPGVALAMADAVRDVATLTPGWILLGGFVYVLSVLAGLGWLFLPAAYAGASLCRDAWRARPWSDVAHWALIALLFASIWFTDVYGAFPGLEPMGWGTTAFVFAASAAMGGLLGWGFRRLTGDPVYR